MSKKMIWSIVVALVVVFGGGSVFAYMTIVKSDKAEYFQAEKSTFEYMKDKASEQFESELEWNEKIREKPVDTSVELSAQYHALNDLADGTGEMFDIEDIINNSSLTFNTQFDLKEHQMRTGFEADITNFKLDDLGMYLDDDRLVIDPPFLDDSLQIHNEDFNDLIEELDPSAENVDVDFGSFFEAAQGIPEDDIERLKEDYIISVYENLPKDAFDSENETIEVDGDDVKTKKITMDLSENEVKDVIVSMLEKAQDDEELQELVKKQLQAQMLGISVESADLDIETDVDQMFDEDLDDAIDFVKNDMEMPDGITSVVWVENDLIVKRDLSITAGEGDESGEFIVKGTNVLDDEQQKYDYELTVVDPNDEEHTVEFVTDMAMKDDEIENIVEISFADVKLTYEDESTLDDGNRDFERTFNFTSQELDFDGSLVWSGNSKYDGDQMSSENEFTVETPMLGDIEASLFADTNTKIIKEVEAPNEDSVKDLGGMSENEIQQYVEQDVMPKAQAWIMEQLGGFVEFGPQQDFGFGDDGADDFDDLDESVNDQEDFEDADEETTTLGMEDIGIEMTVDIKHKQDMVTHFEQKTMINYEETGITQDEYKENVEAENEELGEVDGVEIDYDYGDEEIVETMIVNVEEGQLELMKQMLGDLGNEDFVSFEAVAEFLEGQGFEVK